MQPLTSDAIKQALAERGLSQSDLARHLNLIPNKVSLSLSGKRQWKVGEADRIRALLFSSEEAEAPSRLRTIPIIGQVAAGRWREAVGQSLNSMPAPDPSVPPKAFALRVQGDSMDLLVEEGGTIIVDPDDKALFPGRYYVVLNAENEATFKQFKADPARLVPCSTNPAHEEMLIGGEPFEVIGRIIWRAARM